MQCVVEVRRTFIHRHHIHARTINIPPGLGNDITFRGAQGFEAIVNRGVLPLR